MQNRNTDRATRQTKDATPATRGTGVPLPRRIDCGVATEDRPAHARTERGDARHSWLTSRGMYADQGQAI